MDDDPSIDPVSPDLDSEFDVPLLVEVAGLAKRNRFPWVYAGVLWTLSLLGSILVIPYSLALLKQVKNLNLAPELLPFALGVGVVAEVLISTVAIAIGLGLGPKVNLGWPPIDGWGEGSDRPGSLAKAMLWGLGLGSACGASFLVLTFGFGNSIDNGANLKLPTGFESLLGSIGAGIREEVWLRLGVMTFFAWLGCKLTRCARPGPVVVWTAMLIASLLFAAIHIPQASQLLGLTPAIVAFIFLGNGVPGLVFGWLFCARGLSPP